MILHAPVLNLNLDAFCPTKHKFSIMLWLKAFCGKKHPIHVLMILPDG